VTTIYVRTSGNDSTGNGTTGTPYKTLAKAIAAAAAGDTILMGDGTYAEDSGSGYLSVTRQFGTTPVIVAPESGLPGKVIVTGGSSTANAVIFGNATGFTFDNITFQCQANTVNYAVRFSSGSEQNLLFTRCTFTTWSQAGQKNTCVKGTWTAASMAAANIAFEACTFNQIGHWAAYGLYLDANPSDSNGGASNIEVRSCQFRMGGVCIYLRGVTNAKITGNDALVFAEVNHAFVIGVDGPTGRPCSGVIMNNTFRSRYGHGAVVGAGSDGVLFAGNRVHGGGDPTNGQGLVLKSAHNTRVEKNVVTGGTLSGLYFKGAVDCQAFDNVIYNASASSPALKVGVNSDDGSKCQRLTVRRNYFHVTAGKGIDWGAASEDAGGCVCDENVYSVTGTATLGTVRGTAIAKLSDLRAAWTGYDQSNNDRNSRIGATRAVFAGTPVVDLP
jgi:hypothetical protein